MSLANSLERQMLSLINQERAERGIAPLKLELQLNESAEGHSDWMLRTDTFSHTGSGGSSAGDRMEDAGFDFTGSWRWGENVAWQSERGAVGLSDDVANLHEALMNSSGHRANILNANFDYIGIGIETGDFRGYDAVMITQNFARTSAPVQVDNGGTSNAPRNDPPPQAAPAAPSGPELIVGGAARNTLNGTSGEDLIRGLGGNDQLNGKGGNDRLEGGDGKDQLNGGSGADTLDGGSGKDRADYIWAATSVRADLEYANVNTGEARGDRYISIEHLRGSKNDDMLGGDGNANKIWGAAGDDVIRGRGGNDLLQGAGGDDELHGQSGNDRLKGGTGADTFVFQVSNGRDSVLDFEDDIDQLDFRALSYDSIGALFQNASNVNGNATIRLEGNHSVLVKNTTLEQLQDDILI